MNVHSNRPRADIPGARVGRMIAPGVWADQKGNLYLSLQDALAHLRWPDNIVNRRTIARSLQPPPNPSVTLREARAAFGLRLEALFARLREEGSVRQ